MASASVIRTEVPRETENGSPSTTAIGRDPAKPSWQSIPGAMTTEVHHKKKHLGDAIIFWDEGNWMGL